MDLVEPRPEPPPGFTFAEMEEVTLINYPLRFGTPEINFNEYSYFYYHDHYSFSALRNCALASLVKEPNSGKDFLTQNFTNGFYMWKWPEDQLLPGPLMPGHLPNYNDLVELVPEEVEALLFWYLSQVEYWHPRFLPIFTRFILDPKVEIPKEGFIYKLRVEKRLTVTITTYRPKVRCFHVFKRMSHINMHIRMSIFHLEGTMYKRQKWNYVCMKGKVPPEYCQSFLPKHTSVVVWNCKSATRPSFKDNFNKINEMCSPRVLILLESRCYHSMFSNLYQTLDTTMLWSIAECEGISGGIVVMWEANYVDVSVAMIQEGEASSIKARIMGKQRLISGRRLFAP